MSDFNSQHNRFVWVDIPVADLPRAFVFYAAVLGVDVHCGTVLLPPHSIGPHGFRAIITDSEGNRMALHSSDGV